MCVIALIYSYLRTYSQCCIRHKGLEWHEIVKALLIKSSFLPDSTCHFFSFIYNMIDIPVLWVKYLIEHLSYFFRSSIFTDSSKKMPWLFHLSSLLALIYTNIIGSKITHTKVIFLCVCTLFSRTINVLRDFLFFPENHILVNFNHEYLH